MKTTLYYSTKFSAAHKLPNYNGPCGRLHGHDWKLEIWLTWDKMPALDKSGISVDFTRLKQWTHGWLDHQYVNDFVDPPSAENITQTLVEKLGTHIGNPAPNTIKVRVWESEHSYFEAVQDQ